MEEHLAAVRKLERLSKRKVNTMLMEKKFAKHINSNETIVIPAPAVAPEKSISVKPAKA